MQPSSTFPALTRFPVTAGVGIFAMLATLAWWGKMDVSCFFMDDRTWQGELWRPFASILLHLDLIHLAFNLYWFWAFGVVLERVFGWRTFAGIILFFAAGSSLAQYATDTAGVGLSGVVYGLFALLWLLSYRDARFSGTIHHQTIALFLFWFFLCILLTAAGIWRVGNVAHGMGAILGALLGWALTARGPARLVPWVGLVCIMLLTLWGASLGRWYVNVTRQAGDEFARLAYSDLQAERWEWGASRLRRALEFDNRQAGWWINLGIAYQQLGQSGQAEKAYEQALELQPTAENRTFLANCKAILAYEKQVAGDHKGAVSLYQEALEIDASQSKNWYNLGSSFQHLGDHEKALDAYQQALQREPTNHSFRTAVEQLRRFLALPDKPK